jgi:hypothetical protein
MMPPTEDARNGQVCSYSYRHSPSPNGQWLFTGSQEVPLMRGISESMAGRTAILQLLPFSLAETEKRRCHGGPPKRTYRELTRNRREV